MPRFLITSALTWIVLCASPRAQVAWEVAAGPHRAYGALAAGYGAVFASTNGSDQGGGCVYRSADEGRTWARTAFCPTGSPVPALAVTDAGDVFVSPTSATPDAFLVRLTLEGERDTVFAFEGGNVYALAADGAALWAGTTGGLYRSDDRGHSWTRLDGGALGGHRVLALAVLPGGEPGAPGLLVGTTDGAFAYPEGGGPLAPAGLASRTVGTLRVIAGALWAGTDGGLYRSDDGGATWSPAGLAGLGVWGVAAAGGVLVATTDEGASVSADGGATWGPAAGVPPGPAFGVLGVGPAALVSAVRGLYRTEDGGQTWEQRGFSETLVQDLAFGRGLTFAATRDGGVHRSTDGGRTWAPTPLLATTVSVHVAPSGDVFAGLFGYGGVYRSRDVGETWEPVGLSDAFRVTGFAGLPGGVLLAAVDGDPLVRRSDDGGTWEPVAGLPSAAAAQGEVRLLMLPDGAALAVAAGWLYRSDDEGRTWGAAYSFPGASGEPASAVAAGPDGALYTALGGRHVYRSADGGATWTALPEPPFEVLALAATADGALYAGGRFGDAAVAVWRPGAGWTDASAGLPELPRGLGYAGVNVLAGAPDGRLVAGTEGFGVYGGMPVVSDEGAPSPQRAFWLEVPHPNPSSGTVTVPVEVGAPVRVTVAVYDVRGRRVAVLHDGPLVTGRHVLTLDTKAENLAPGLYLVRAGGGEVRRIVVVQ